MAALSPPALSHSRATSEEMMSKPPKRAQHSGKGKRKAPAPRPTARAGREHARVSGTVAERAPEQPCSLGEPRRPRQERGQRRVDSILDAAADLLTEEGVGAVTMHGVARRSGTTTGSMYHFFPDRETLLHALAERHTESLRALVTQTEREAAAQWSHLSTVEAVRQFLDPFLTYVDQHPDLLPLMRFTRTTDWGADRDPEMDRVVSRLAEAVVASRNPTASTHELASRAVTMTAMAEGVVCAAASTSGPHGGALSAAILRRELRRALVAYLDSYAEPQARG